MRVAFLGPLIQSRSMCWITSGALVLHISLVHLGLPSWSCPFRQGIDLPCPGCGLSRALEALIQGHWGTAIEIHAFSPFAALFIALVMGASVLPNSSRYHLGQQITHLEQRTGITLILVSLFILYWLSRLIFFPSYLDMIS